MEKIHCECGCGKEINKFDNRGRERFYSLGHFGKFNNPNIVISCGCGCGLKMLQYDDRGRIREYIAGHSSKLYPPNKGKSISEDVREKLRKANQGKKASKSTKLKMSQSHQGKKSRFWRGGKYKMVSGYICVYSPNHPLANRDKYVMEHRLVMEKVIGRYLRPEEVVHHIDKDVSNNKPDNLLLFADNSEHIKYHASIRRKTL